MTTCKWAIALVTCALLVGCDSYEPGYCTALVKAYEECRADGECWSHRHQWGTVSYMSELNECHGRIARGKP